MKNIKYLLILASTTIFFGCSHEKSKTTGWNYNDPEHGGFERSEYFSEQIDLECHCHSELRIKSISSKVSRNKISGSQFLHQTFCSSQTLR